EELARRGLILKAEGVDEAEELVRRSVEDGEELRARALAFRRSLVDPAALAAEEAVKAGQRLNPGDGSPRAARWSSGQ
ncbi:MAG: hypothetical protein ACP5L2_08235, partial [Conexivisphaera sp.]